MRRLRALVVFLLFSCSGAAVFAVYLIVPSIIAVNAIFQGSVVGLIAVLATLAVTEVLIFGVLIRTTWRRAALLILQERRASVRQKASFHVEISEPHAGALAPGQRIRALAVDSSAGGLAVLVEPNQWAAGRAGSRMCLHLRENATVEAEPVDLARVVVDGRPHDLIRLRLADAGAILRPPNGGLVDRQSNGHGPSVDGSIAIPSNGHVVTGSHDAAGRHVGAGVLSVLAALGLGIRRLAAVLPWPLWLVLGVQAGAALSLSNTAFQDEATYLFAGRQIVHHLVGGPAPTMYVGDFLAGTTLYPTLAGALDLAGGLEAARLFSLFCMLCATLGVYLAAKVLYDRTSGLFAASLFGVQGSVLFLSHFATFDAMCVGLLSLAAAMAVCAGASRRLWLSPAVSVVVLLAVATTYIAVLYVPTILALLCWKAFVEHGWRQMLLRGALAGGVLGAAGGYALSRYPTAISAFDSAILHRNAAVPEPWTVLVQLVVYLTVLVTVLAVAGVFFSGGARLPLALSLLVTSLAAPAYHIYDGEFTSLQKHVTYGLIFIAPVAGYALTRLGGHRRLLGVVLCLLIFTTGYQADRRLFDWWPNSSSMIAVVRSQVQPGDRILAEEDEVLQYYLTKYEASLGHLQWSQTYNFSYYNAKGQFLQGVPAYKAAISDGYFDLVILRYSPTVTMDRAIDGGLRDGTRYELVAKIPYDTAFGPSAYWIWRKRPLTAAPRPPLPAQAAVPLLVVHNELHTVLGGRTQPCSLRANTNGPIQRGCVVISSRWLPYGSVTYSLRYPDGTTQTFSDRADGRGHSLHPFAVHYLPPLHAAHGEPSTVVSIQVTATSKDGTQRQVASTRFTVMR